MLSHVWGYDFEPESNVVEVYVRYLRRKLGAETIETIRGMGYRFRTLDDDLSGVLHPISSPIHLGVLRWQHGHP